MLIILSNMENDRWYEEEELYQLAQELNLNHFTVPNLLNYGVKHLFVVPESANTTTTESNNNAEDVEESSFSSEDQRSLEEKIRLKWKENIEKKAQKEKKIAYLEREIANLTEKLEQERQEFKKLNQEAEILQDLLKF